MRASHHAAWHPHWASAANSWSTRCTARCWRQRRAHRVGGSVIKGEYGEGKTHLLNWLYQRAHEENFVVSLISLSKETPFNRFDHIYRKIAEAIHLPGEPYRGVERLLQRLALDPNERQAIMRFSEGLHVKPRTVIRNYLESTDGYHRYLLLGDLEGATQLAAADLRAINQENRLGRVALARVTRQDYWDYIALLRFLIQLGGYAGWLVLFDEAEMIGLLGAGSRATAYGNVADLLGISEHPRGPCAGRTAQCLLVRVKLLQRHPGSPARPRRSAAVVCRAGTRPYTDQVKSAR